MNALFKKTFGCHVPEFNQVSSRTKPRKLSTGSVKWTGGGSRGALRANNLFTKSNRFQSCVKILIISK